MIWLGIVLGILICGIGAVVFWFYMMKDIAQDELNELRNKYNESVQRFNEVNQKLHLYDYLLYDANDTIEILCNIYANEPTEELIDNIYMCTCKLIEIAGEYRALQDKMTTGYHYSGKEEEDAKLLDGYELIGYEDENLVPEPTIEIDEDDE